MTTVLLTLASLALVASFSCLLRPEDICTIRIAKFKEPPQTKDSTRRRQVLAYGLYVLAILGYLLTSQQWALASNTSMPIPQPITLQQRLSNHHQHHDIVQEILGMPSH